MTLDEHIARAESDARKAEFDTEWGMGNYFIDRSEALQYAKECRQLAEWLKELKDYRVRMPSYEAGYNDAKREIALSGEYERAYQRGQEDVLNKIRALVDGTIDHFDLDDAMDLLYEIKKVVRKC
jgi:hypothetical protein